MHTLTLRYVEFLTVNSVAWGDYLCEGIRLFFGICMFTWQEFFSPKIPYTNIHAGTHSLLLHSDWLKCWCIWSKIVTLSIHILWLSNQMHCCELLLLVLLLLTLPAHRTHTHNPIRQTYARSVDNAYFAVSFSLFLCRSSSPHTRSKHLGNVVLIHHWL